MLHALEEWKPPQNAESYVKIIHPIVCLKAFHSSSFLGPQFEGANVVRLVMQYPRMIFDHGLVSMLVVETHPAHQNHLAITSYPKFEAISQSRIFPILTYNPRSTQRSSCSLSYDEQHFTHHTPMISFRNSYSEHQPFNFIQLYPFFLRYLSRPIARALPP